MNHGLRFLVRLRCKHLSLGGSKNASVKVSFTAPSFTLFISTVHIPGTRRSRNIYVTLRARNRTDFEVRDRSCVSVVRDQAFLFFDSSVYVFIGFIRVSGISRESGVTIIGFGLFISIIDLSIVEVEVRSIETIGNYCV